jgi:hypothetical protein
MCRVAVGRFVVKAYLHLRFDQQPGAHDRAALEVQDLLPHIIRKAERVRGGLEVDVLADQCFAPDQQEVLAREIAVVLRLQPREESDSMSQGGYC